MEKQTGSEQGGQLLGEINEKIRKLLGDRGNEPIEQLPEFEEIYHSLRGKRVFVADGHPPYLALAVVAPLMVATDGEASFLNPGEIRVSVEEKSPAEIKQEQIDALVSKIIKEDPEIVLLDLELGGLGGDVVAKKLKERGFRGQIVGYASSPSSDLSNEKFSDAKESFLQAGAIGCLKRGPRVVDDLAELIAGYEENKD